MTSPVNYTSTMTLQRLVVQILTLVVVCQTTGCDADIVQNTTAPYEENLSSSIEEKVLGPLRIWHIVFIVSFFLLIAMIAVFCCVEIRVPLSRQEIEENYKKRLMNLQYVRMLEKAPEELLRTEFPKPEIAVISSKETENPKKNQQQTSGNRGWQQATKNAVSGKTSSKQDVDGTSGGQGFSMLSGMLGKTAGGGPKPLAINPRDILAIMAQQRKTKTEDS